LQSFHESKKGKKAIDFVKEKIEAALQEKVVTVIDMYIMEKCELILNQPMCLKHCIRLIDRTHLPPELPLRLCDSFANCLI
jgi:hypothetical protein